MDARYAVTTGAEMPQGYLEKQKMKTDFRDCVLRVYDGMPPASAQDVLTDQHLLCEVALSADGSRLEGNVLLTTGIGDVGITKWYRAYELDGTTVRKQGLVSHEHPGELVVSRDLVSGVRIVISTGYRLEAEST